MLWWSWFQHKVQQTQAMCSEPLAVVLFPLTARKYHSCWSSCPEKRSAWTRRYCMHLSRAVRWLYIKDCQHKLYLISISDVPHWVFGILAGACCGFLPDHICGFPSLQKRSQEWASMYLGLVPEEIQVQLEHPEAGAWKCSLVSWFWHS